MARDYTDPAFSFLRGFEWTNDQENHINVLGSQNWTSRATTGDASLMMAPFWTWLATEPTTDPSGTGIGFGGADGVGQFNHPGSKGALNWDDYAFNPGTAEQMALITVRGNQNKDGLGDSDAGWYWFALSQGWTVSPTMNWDWHTWNAGGVFAAQQPGADCGVDGYLPCQRSLVIAADSRPESLYAALRARRTSASEKPDLWATLRGPGGVWQGSTVAAVPGETITLRVDAGSASTALTSVDIVSDAGVSPFPYYYGENAPCGLSGCDVDSFEQGNLTPPTSSSSGATRPPTGTRRVRRASTRPRPARRSPRWRCRGSGTSKR